MLWPDINSSKKERGCCVLCLCECLTVCECERMSVCSVSHSFMFSIKKLYKLVLAKKTSTVYTSTSQPCWQEGHQKGRYITCDVWVWQHINTHWTLKALPMIYALPEASAIVPFSSYPCIHVNLYGLPVNDTDLPPLNLLMDVNIKSYGFK